MCCEPNSLLPLMWRNRNRIVSENVREETRWMKAQLTPAFTSSIVLEIRWYQRSHSEWSRDWPCDTTATGSRRVLVRPGAKSSSPGLPGGEDEKSARLFQPL